jgi:hypothetical protein
MKFRLKTKQTACCCLLTSEFVSFTFVTYKRILIETGNTIYSFIAVLVFFYMNQKSCCNRGFLINIFILFC